MTFKKNAAGTKNGAVEPLSSEEWIKLGKALGELVAEKNAAYGDSFRNSAKIVSILYPCGVQPEQIPTLLTIVRVIDKLSRIATDPTYNKEDPGQDIAGYGLLLHDLLQRGL